MKSTEPLKQMYNLTFKPKPPVVTLTSSILTTTTVGSSHLFTLSLLTVVILFRDGLSGVKSTVEIT